MSNLATLVARLEENIRLIDLMRAELGMQRAATTSRLKELGQFAEMRRQIVPVLKWYALPACAILGRSRKQDIVQARYEAMMLLYVCSGESSFSSIARFFKVDHGTVSNAVKRINAQFVSGPNVLCPALSEALRLPSGLRPPVSRLPPPSPAGGFLMPLSKKQTSLHWRLWAEVLKVQGWRHLSAIEQTSRRHAAYKLALGAAKSLTEFTNSDFDRVLATFKTLIDPLDLQAQMDVRMYEEGVDPGLRDRLEWVCFNSGFPASYVEKIAASKFNGECYLKNLTIKQLQQLRLTLKERARAHNRASPAIRAADLKKSSHVAPQPDDDNCPY